MTRKKSESNDSKKSAIQEAAKHLFIERGYAASSMQQIADAAGCTKSVLYHYYKDKEALWGAVKDHVLSRFATSHEQIFSSKIYQSLDAFLDATVLQRFTVYSESTEVQRMVMWQNLELEHSSSDKKDKESPHPWVAPIIDLQKREELRADIEPMVIVHLLLAAGTAGTFSTGAITSTSMKAAYKKHVIKMLKDYLTKK